MATVYEARDSVLARTVAVKVLHSELVEDPTFLERFRREALAAARLAHPNIVAIYDTGADSGRHYIVMEFCAGGTLRDFLAREGPLSPDRVLAIGSSICDALGYAHDNDVVHRDVKPANVLIAGDGTLKVADFGIAKAAFAGRDITTSGSMLGSVNYVSPEQARGEEPDHRSDVYSLGVVLFEAATGRPPFTADTALATAMKHLQDEPQRPRSLRAGIPRDLDEAILAALRKDPSARPQSAAELKILLGGHRAETAVMPAVRPPASPPKAQTSGDMGWVVRIVALVAVVVALAVTATWLLGDESPLGRSRDRSAPAGGPEIAIQSVADFDPVSEGGDGEEHSSEAQAAADGNDATRWSTETYDDPFEVQGKSGVGLVFDLGSETDVGEIEVVTSTPGMDIEILVADEPATSLGEFTPVTQISGIGTDDRVDIGDSGRYWLLWITGLPGDGTGVGTVSEVRFRGS